MIKQYWKQLILLIALITCCSIGAHVLTGGETLSDYADANPSLAYASSSSHKASVKATYSHSSTTSVTTSSSYESSNTASSATASSSHKSSNTASSATASSSYESSNTASSADSDITGDDMRTTYKDGFYYEEIPTSVIHRIYGLSFPENATIELSSLRYCVIKYIDFNNETVSGEIICNKAIADDFMEIFYELYTSGYQLESVKLVDDYDADDEKSMEANNTSCFNYRVIAGTTRLSKHSLGLAVDINPLYNPYITYDDDGTENYAPLNGKKYADRSLVFPYKIDESDLAYKLFTQHGFTWGGHWNNRKDYQHFEKDITK